MEGLLQKLIDDWVNCNVHNAGAINNYLDIHESALVTFGFFIRGLRIIPVKTDSLLFNYDQTIDGMRGIIAMNVKLIRSKLTVLKGLPNVIQ